MWQRQWLAGEELQRQSEYWRRTLEGAPALLELPADRPRPAQQEYAGDVVWVELDAELTRGLKTLSRRHGATLYMTLLAGWATVLSRLSGQAEVVIGTPVANRTRAELERLIGFFVNTQALRVAVRGTAGELLEQVKGRALDAQEHQDLPFEQVVETGQGAAKFIAHAHLPGDAGLAEQRGRQAGTSRTERVTGPHGVRRGEVRSGTGVERSRRSDRWRIEICHVIVRPRHDRAACGIPAPGSGSDGGR